MPTNQLQFGFGLAALCAALCIPTSAHASPPEAEGDASGSISLGGGGAEADADADAEAPDADADADVDADADADADAAAPPKATDRGDKPWIKRWAPEPMMGEVGIYGGILLPTPNHEWFGPDRDLPDQGFRELNALSPDIGLRGGFYPLRFFGVEAEGGVMPSSAADGSGSALLYTVRGSLVGQLGLWSVTPFVLVGAGAFGVSSDRSVLGNDVDPALHWGGGVKVFINRYLMLRLDIRDVVSYKRGVDNVFTAHSPEILLGLSVTLGRKKNEPTAPADSDGDGILDYNDSCPDEAETFNDFEDKDGCPEQDSDGDGMIDGLDSCPDEAENFNEYKDEDGCPEPDSDGDGLYDDQDSCPEQAETFNEYKDEDGCPEEDPDGDRFYDEQDQCPQEPESDNGYKDDDGCPDEVPKEVQAFTGAIKGITFENNKDEIRSSSTRTLDKAVKVLTENPGIRIKIVGHTDDKGDHDHNVDLSQRRAESVKKYFVDAGIDESRIETEGKGPDVPIDSNKTKAGRANNRRIEFEILRQSRSVGVTAE